MNLLTNAASQPPATRRTDHIDRLHGVEVPDPYRWLEDVDSADIKTWIRAQNEHTQSVLSNVSFGDKVRERVGVLSAYEIVGIPKGAGNRRFFTLQTTGAKQPSLVWTQSGDDEIHCLLDPETLAEDATISIMGFEPSPSGRYLAYGLSEAGSDWQKWYVMDVDAGRRLEDELHWIRFTIPSWRDDESGFFYTGSEPPPPREVHKALATKRSIRFHHLGEAQVDGETVYERPDQSQWLISGRVSSDDHFLVITIQKGTHRQNLVSVLDLTNSKQQIVDLVKEFEASYAFLGNDGSRLYFQTDLDAPFGRIVAIDLETLEGMDWKTVVGESEGVLQQSVYVRGQFIVSALVDAESQVRVYDNGGEQVHQIDLPGCGTVSWLEGRANGTNVYLSYSDVVRPTMILRHNLETGETDPFREIDLPYGADAFVTERHVYKSTDGTVISIFLSRKRATTIGPDTPTCLYGYGGFNIPLSPSFRLDHLAWMDLGGQLAVACIRGGGEYGREWHQSGACENRPNVFADFIAAAEWLVETNRTSTPKLVIHGRSNGGLLVGACMTKRPDLYGACLPAVGVLDMLRFHQFTVGSFWMSDYGSPDDADMFPILMSYSPLHNVEKGTAYPPTLVTTADHDDRVFPAHSFKFAATLQHAQSGDNPILLRIDERAGHGLGKPKAKLLDEIADNWIFALAALGAEPGFD